MMRRTYLFATALLCVACGDDSSSDPSDPADAAVSGCTETLAASRSFGFFGPTGDPAQANVTSDLRCDDSIALTVEAEGTTYTIQLTANRAELTAEGTNKITAEWNAAGGLIMSAGESSVGEPLRSYLLLRANEISDFDAVGLALLDWGALSRALDLDGADPEGNDPAGDAETLPTGLRFLQDHPPVLRMEKGDLTTARSEALVSAMMVMMSDEAVTDFHHYELCHIGELFFTGHDAFVDRMEAHVKGFTPTIDLPFGRLPWHEPGGQIPDAYAVWSPIADAFYADLDACGTYPRRACTDELRYTVKFSTPEVKNQYACDPADRATWCDGLLLGLACSELIGTQVEDYLGCEDDDGDGLPDQCPYGLLRRFQGEALCDYATVDDLWVEMIDWHGQVHDRIGGAHGDHAMTASTPMFWLFHVTLGALYEGYLRCP